MYKSILIFLYRPTYCARGYSYQSIDYMWFFFHSFWFFNLFYQCSVTSHNAKKINKGENPLLSRLCRHPSKIKGFFREINFTKFFVKLISRKIQTPYFWRPHRACQHHTASVAMQNVEYFYKLCKYFCTIFCFKIYLLSEINK